MTRSRWRGRTRVDIRVIPAVSTGAGPAAAGAGCRNRRRSGRSRPASHRNRSRRPPRPWPRRWTGWRRARRRSRGWSLRFLPSSVPLQGGARSLASRPGSPRAARCGNIGAMPRNRLPPWHEEFVLPNRRAILIRPIRPEDAAPLHAAFGLLGPGEIRVRFGGTDGELDLEAAGQMARPDPRQELLLVGAEPFAPGEAMIAALGRARRVPGTREAECAILLARYVAGLGLGRHLLQKLVKWARGRSVERLFGDIPATNTPMRELADSMGFQVDPDADVPPGLVRVVLDLGRD